MQDSTPQLWFKKKGKRLFLEPDYASFSRTSAAIVINALDNVLKIKDFAVFVPSAGRTPLTLYNILSSLYRNSIDWKRVVVIQMDEYLKIPHNDPNSFAYSIKKFLIAPLGIKQYIHFFDDNGFLVKPLDEYENIIEKLGGIDLVVHGMGGNGHIGFNEPGSEWSSSTRIVNLFDSTIEANFGKIDNTFVSSYRQGVTIGLRSFVLARMAILLISGEGKDNVTKKLFTENPNTNIPATSLSLNEKVEIVINLESLSPRTRAIIFDII